MKILYVASQYDYGVPSQGHSFEHENFYDCLSHLGHDVLYFDPVQAVRDRGREFANQHLYETAIAERPELMFCVLTDDELDAETIRRISALDDVTTCNWFCDDHWRFESFSRRWAPAFNWVVTTDAAAVDKYRVLGQTNVLKSQWGVNPFRYRRAEVAPEYDVTFVGRAHGMRWQIVQALRDRGIRIATWGSGWPAGRVSPDEMMHIFNASKINLNLSAASTKRRRRWQRTVDGCRRYVARGLLWPQLDGAERFLSRNGVVEQIKGRDFEVPGCGGFLLTAGSAELAEYYRLGHEVGSYRGFDGLVARIEYYLQHEEERRDIAKAGYRRAMTEHSYVVRFGAIFRSMGLFRDGQGRRAAG